MAGACGKVCRRRRPVRRRLMRVLLRVVVAREVGCEHRRHQRTGQHGRDARRAQQHQHGERRKRGNDVRPVQEHVRIDGEGDRERERCDEPGRRARSRPAEGEARQRRECEREERQRAHGLVLRDRAQRVDRGGDHACEAGRPGEGEHAERKRQSRKLPAAHERDQGQRRRERARVERRQLGRVRPEPAEQNARVRPAERAVADRVDHPVGRRRATDQLQPREQRHRGEGQSRHTGADEDREPAPAQLRDEHEQCRGGCDRR